MEIKSNEYLILNSFDTFDLQTLEEANLLDRMDKKYVCNEQDLPELFSMMKDTYDILKIEDRLCFEYKTDYYDTIDFKFYLLHHAGKTSRIKTRVRSYVNDNVNFAEVKHKSNKGLTSKVRYEIDIDSVNPKNILENDVNIHLVKKCVIYYSRFIFLDKAKQEKVTIDTNLRFENKENTVSMDKLCIVELKTNSLYESSLKNIMSKLKINSTSISKYCTAISYLYPEVKNNNFKEKNRLINKIMERK